MTRCKRGGAQRWREGKQGQQESSLHLSEQILSVNHGHGGPNVVHLDTKVPGIRIHHVHMCIGPAWHHPTAHIHDVEDGAGDG